MAKFAIKRVSLINIDQLQEISRQTFYETFSSGNTEANMRKYLEEEFSVEKLTAELSNGNSEFYFATLDARIIGYLKLNFGIAQTELKDDNGIEIERIYVLKEFIGRNMGKLLYEKVVQIAKKRNAGYIWLGVWEENRRAIRFYEKNGFVEFDRHIFRLGDDEQTDIMMRVEVKETSLFLRLA